MAISIAPVRGDARRMAVRKLVKPAKVAASLPFGPQRPSPNYSAMLRLAAEEGSLDASMLEWLRLSRLEWNDLSRELSKFQPARFIWTSASGKRARQWVGASNVSVMCRGLARRAQDAARVLARGLSQASDVHRKAIGGHLRAAASAAASVCNTHRASVEPQVKAWAQSMHAAVANVSSPWLLSLAKVADIKAKTLEDISSRARAKQWRAHLGAGTAPTKAAYRWVRGLVAWHHSPIGAAALNDAVPDEGENGDVDLVPSELSDPDSIRVALADQVVCTARLSSQVSCVLPGTPSVPSVRTPRIEFEQPLFVPCASCDA